MLPEQTQQIIVFIIGMLIVVIGAYYVTRFVGMKASGQTRAGLRNRNIKIIDRYAIARDKQFCVVEVADKVYVLGVTTQGMTLLDTYDAEEFAELVEDSGESVPWNMTPVGRYGNRLTRKVVEYVAVKTGKKQKYDAIHGDSDSDADEADFASSFENAQRDEKRRKNVHSDEVRRETIRRENAQRMGHINQSEGPRVTSEIDDALNIIDSLAKKHDDVPSGRSDVETFGEEWTVINYRSPEDD